MLGEKEKEISEPKIDLSKLGQFYSPIDYFEYGPSQAPLVPESNDISPIDPKKSDNNNNIESNSPNKGIISNKKKIKSKL